MKSQTIDSNNLKFYEKILIYFNYILKESFEVYGLKLHLVLQSKHTSGIRFLKPPLEAILTFRFYAAMKLH